MIKTTVAVLQDAVRAASLVVERRNATPILGSILVTATRDGVALSSTNMDQYVSVNLTPVECDQAATFTIRSKPLLAALKMAQPDDLVAITTEALQTKVMVGGFGLALGALNPNSFPALKDEGDDVRSFNIKAGELRRIVGAAAYCVSTEETRYYLNGVNLQPVDDNLVAVATDGHRLMIAATPIPEGARKLPSSNILPTKMVGVLREFLRRLPAEQEVRVTTNRKTFRVDHGDSWSITTKLIDGVFPAYDRVVPAKKNDAAQLIVADPKAFVRSIHQIKSISNQRSTPVVFAGNASGIALSVSSDGDNAEIKMEADVCHWQDKALLDKFGFQARYLIAAAVAFPSGFTMQILDANAPCRIEGKEGVAVLMPMRV